MMAKHIMLAWQFCDFSGDPDKYNAKKPNIFCNFPGGVGGSRPPVPPLDLLMIGKYIEDTSTVSRCTLDIMWPSV